MIFKYFHNCFCPRIIDEDEIGREHSDDSIATILPCDFIPENEFKNHPVNNTRYSYAAVATAYNTSIARSNHGLPGLVLSHDEDQPDHHNTIEQLRCKWI